MLRGDNELITIGEGSNIQDASLEWGRPCSTARLGNNCLIGAKALIPEGRTIPDHSLVIGVPGKVVRVLSAEEIEGLTKSALGYAENWKRYARGFKEIH